MPYDNTNSGALFKNDDKATDRHPDAKGPCDIKCPCCGEVSRFYISAWTKTAGPTAKNPGQRFQSLSFSEPMGSREPSPRPTPSSSSPLPADDESSFDDIPF